MRRQTRKRFGSTDTSVRALLRGVGRVAIWGALGLVVLRGVVATPGVSEPPARSTTSDLDPTSAAFAVRFARAFLADPRRGALEPLMAEGARLPAGSPTTPAVEVAQAEVSDYQDLGDGRLLVTVACELRDARVLHLAVPIARPRSGDAAALGAPSFVADTGTAGVASTERPRPIAGPDAAAIEGLVAKFLPAYVSSVDPGALAYLLAPGASVAPLGGAVGLDSISGVSQLGSGEGSRRSVLAAGRVSDSASGAVYPVSYRLELSRGTDGRWYVRSVEGASS